MSHKPVIGAAAYLFSHWTGKGTKMSGRVRTASTMARTTMELPSLLVLSLASAPGGGGRKSASLFEGERVVLRTPRGSVFLCCALALMSFSGCARFVHQ